MQNLKSTKAITLIALVITVVILIILAGVSISFIAGDTGLLKSTRNGRNNFVVASNEEDVVIKSIEEQLEDFASGENN